MCYSILKFNGKKEPEINKKTTFLRSNEQIRFTPITLIEENGENLGIKPLREALDMAYEKGLDLVEINPTNRPPICKIMDFGKYKYDLAKKDKDTKAKRKVIELKEIRLTFRIGEHDIDYKAKQAKEFFGDGNMVKVSMRLRGRENGMVETALSVFTRFVEKANLDYENRPRKMGNQIVAMLAKKKEEKQAGKQVSNKPVS